MIKMEKYIHIKSGQTFILLGKGVNLFGKKVFHVRNEKTNKDYEYLISGLKLHFKKL